MHSPDAQAIPRHAPPPHRFTILAALSVVTACALGLRLAALANGLPFQSDADAVIVTQAMGLERGAPRSGALPISPLYPHLPALSLVALPGEVVHQAPADAPWESHATAAAHPLLLARRWLALLSTLAIPGAFFLARRFLSPAWALFAACLLATSLLHLVFTRQARPHGPLTAATLWTLISAMHLARRPTCAASAACSVCTALAIGILHSGTSILPIVALASLIAAYRSTGLARAACALPLAAAYASFRLFYPFVGTHGVLATRKDLPNHVFDGSGFAAIARSCWSFDPVLTSLAAVGTLYACSLAWRRRRQHEPWCSSDVALVAAFALPYLAVLGSYARALHRFALPLTPVLALLGAAGAQVIVRTLARRHSSATAQGRTALLLAGVALIPPSAAALRWVWLSATPNSATIAARWVAENTSPERETVAISAGLHLPLPCDPEGLETVPEYARSPMQRYLEEHPARPNPGPAYRLRTLIPLTDTGAADIREESVADLLAELAPHYAVVTPPTNHAGQGDGTLAAIKAAGGVLVERIETYDVRGDFSIPRHRRGGSFGYEAFSLALRAKARGRPIEIYRLP
ncbi:MAG: hypothetical protein QGI46_04045 [Planctomycetota bacterium]|nr:hypothetical protein [Planctomycetota bacterium]